MTDWSRYVITGSSGVAQSAVDKLESRLGVKFPDAYRDLVQYADQAIFEVAQFPYGDEGDETGISEFFECSPEERPYTVAYFVRGQQPPVRLIPIARDAGDFQICFSYDSSGSGEPSIVLEDPFSKQIYDVARTFEDFLEVLHD